MNSFDIPMFYYKENHHWIYFERYIFIFNSVQWFVQQIPHVPFDAYLKTCLKHYRVLYFLLTLSIMIRCPSNSITVPHSASLGRSLLHTSRLQCDWVNQTDLMSLNTIKYVYENHRWVLHVDVGNYGYATFIYFSHIIQWIEGKTALTFNQDYTSINFNICHYLLVNCVIVTIKPGKGVAVVTQTCFPS